MGNAWIWLDARAAPAVDRLSAAPLARARFAATGLRAGTPVSLGYVDMVMTALGAGAHTGDAGAACSVMGSTGVHLRSVAAEDVVLTDAMTGYVMCLPVPGQVTQMQSNMAATLNIDWLLTVVEDLLADMGQPVARADLVTRIDGWVARAALQGLSVQHRFPDLMRAVIEGLGLAARDCFSAMGPMPQELRLTGGAARLGALRGILSEAVDAPVRVSGRDEAGAAGAAMMAAVAIGAYDDMDACIADWVTPLLGPPEPPDPGLVATYARLFPTYVAARVAAHPIWAELARSKTGD